MIISVVILGFVSSKKAPILLLAGEGFRLHAFGFMFFKIELMCVRKIAILPASVPL